MTARPGMLAEPPRGTHRTFGGDEWIVVQPDEAMSLGVSPKAQVLTRAPAEKALPGIVEICLSNASYMVRIDPDVVHPAALVEELHDLEFAAELNGYRSTGEFIDAVVSAPAPVSVTGFVPTVPRGCRLAPGARQIEVPKCVRPRTFTPERAFSWGGALSAVYPVDAAGGHRLFGMCATPVVQPEQTPSATAVRSSTSPPPNGSPVPTRPSPPCGSRSMALEIPRAGLMTTVQDEGRAQGCALGMPPSGAMEARARPARALEAIAQHPWVFRSYE